jgi:hypothetical protein
VLVEDATHRRFITATEQPDVYQQGIQIIDVSPYFKEAISNGA